MIKLDTAIAPSKLISTFTLSISSTKGKKSDCMPRLKTNHFGAAITQRYSD